MSETVEEGIVIDEIVALGEAQDEGIQIPAEFTIGALRQEIANINDERVILKSQVQWLSTIVQALQHQLDHGHTHEDGDHSH